MLFGDDGRGDRRLRPLHRGQGVVPLDPVRDPRRGAQPDLPRAGRLRRRRHAGRCTAERGSCPASSRPAPSAYLLDTTPYHNTEHLYSDALGLAILAVAEPHDGHFTTTDARRLLFGILIGTVVAAAARELVVTAGREARRGARSALPAGTLLAVLIVGWNLTGEIVGRGRVELVRRRRSAACCRRRRTGSTEATGRRADDVHRRVVRADPNAFWSLEFWNQSIEDVWSVDAIGTRPGPGDHAELHRTRRRGRPAAAARLGRGAAPGSTSPGALVADVRRA